MKPQSTQAILRQAIAKMPLEVVKNWNVVIPARGYPTFQVHGHTYKLRLEATSAMDFMLSTIVNNTKIGVYFNMDEDFTANFVGLADQVYDLSKYGNPSARFIKMWLFGL